MTNEQTNALTTTASPAAALALTGGINFAFDKSDLVSIMEQRLTDGYKSKLKDIREVLATRAKIDNRFHDAINKATQSYVESRYSVDSAEFATLVSALKTINDGEKPDFQMGFGVVNVLDEKGRTTNELAINVAISIAVSSGYNSRTGRVDPTSNANGNIKINRLIPLTDSIQALRARHKVFQTNNSELLALQAAVDQERRELPTILLRIRSTLAQYAYSQSEQGRQALNVVGAGIKGDLTETTEKMFADLKLNVNIPVFNEDLTGI